MLPSGRKNVLRKRRKLLRIPYRRLTAGFSVCWLAVSTVYVCEMHEVRTFAPCRGLYSFFIRFLLLFLFFRHLKITLDPEQPMLKEEPGIIPSVWGGINVLNIFKEASIFLIIVHSSCELIFAFHRRAELKPACIHLLVVTVTFFTCPDFLIYHHVAPMVFRALLYLSFSLRLCFGRIFSLLMVRSPFVEFVRFTFTSVHLVWHLWGVSI